MSRARELAKVGGKNQQVIAGLSSHVGVSTFLNNVHMFANLDVGGNVTVTGTTTFNGATHLVKNQTLQKQTDKKYC